MTLPERAPGMLASSGCEATASKSAAQPVFMSESGVSVPLAISQGQSCAVAPPGGDFSVVEEQAATTSAAKTPSARLARDSEGIGNKAGLARCDSIDSV